jgi:hypothetical protein
MFSGYIVKFTARNILYNTVALSSTGTSYSVCDSEIRLMFELTANGPAPTSQAPRTLTCNRKMKFQYGGAEKTASAFKSSLELLT